MNRNSRALPKIIFSTLKNLLDPYYENLTDEALEALLSQQAPKAEKIYWTYREAAELLLVTPRHIVNLIQASEAKITYFGQRSPRLDKKAINSLITCRKRYGGNKNKDAS